MDVGAQPAQHLHWYGIERPFEMNLAHFVRQRSRLRKRNQPHDLAELVQDGGSANSSLKLYAGVIGALY